MDHDAINNKRVRAIAKAHGCTVAEVNAALDRHPIEIDRDLYLKRTLALELLRLDELEEAFRAKAMSGDVASGSLLVKIYGRRATLLGLNPPLGHAVHVVQHEPAERLSSTDKIERVLNALIGPPKPAEPGDDKLN